MVFDWPALMRVGLQHLRLQPEQFWALTPAEFTLLLGKPGSAAPLSRTRLNELSGAFPDHPEE